MYSYKVLFNGYSRMDGDNQMLANCSCTLILGPKNIIVDTMTPWDAEKILLAFKDEGISPEDIDFVVSTHGHSDHLGNNNLFLKAKHIVGYSISYKDLYYIHPFHKGTDYIIDESVKIVPTPGHTLTDITLVLSVNGNTIAVTGDLFERAEDIKDSSIWLEAGSEAPNLQRKNRSRIADLATHIVPGHGEPFIVTPEIRCMLKEQCMEYK